MFFEDIQMIPRLAERAGLSQRIQSRRHDKTLWNLDWCGMVNDLLTAGQQVNLHITIDFVAPNVRTYNELAMALDAFSSVVSSACIV